MAILKYIAAECNEGSYRVLEVKDLINALPKKYKADGSTLLHIMQYLEKGNYISIKYKDAKMFCVSPLPFARQMLENESFNRQKTKKYITMGSMLYILVFIFAFLGAFVAIIVYGLIF